MIGMPFFKETESVDWPVQSTIEDLPYALEKISCIFGDFQERGWWGYLKRSNGDWVWAHFSYPEDDFGEESGTFVEPGNNHYAYDILPEDLKATFIDGSTELAKGIRKGSLGVFKLSQELFEKAFPDHPKTELQASKLSEDIITCIFRAG
jgi:hypothetical protein